MRPIFLISISALWFLARRLISILRVRNTHRSISSLRNMLCMDYIASLVCVCCTCPTRRKLRVLPIHITSFVASRISITLNTSSWAELRQTKSKIQYTILRWVHSEVSDNTNKKVIVIILSSRNIFFPGRAVWLETLDSVSSSALSLCYLSCHIYKLCLWESDYEYE